MKACPLTDALERKIAGGARPDEADRVHAGACLACSAVLDAAERLDRRLGPVVRGMLDEPMPPVSDVLKPMERSALGPLSRAALGIAATAAVVVLVMGALTVGRTVLSGGPSASGTPSPSREVFGAVPDDMAAWVAAAGPSIWSHTDRPGPPPPMALVRLERCGDIGLAFFLDPVPTAGAPLLFGRGNYRAEPYETGFGGVASSVDEPEAAYARSQGVPCTVVFDSVLSPEAALRAYRAHLGADEARVTGMAVRATKLVTASIGMAYLTETRDGAPHQQILVLQRGPDGWVASSGQGGEYPAAGAAVGVSPLGVDKGMPDDRWAAVGVATDGTAAVELEFGGFVHQYPVNGDAFIIQIPSSAGFGLHYRLLDASGDAIGEGTSIP